MTPGEQAIAVLVAAGVQVDDGLTATEIASVEARLGFRFCRSHREFLLTGLPVGDGWPDWRRGGTAELRDRLAAPVDGLLFDIEHNGYWPADWGPKPLADPRAAAGARLAGVPQLVPIYRHRYLPAEPAPEPTPVLSVMQTDVIFYGRDLLAYVQTEFGNGPRDLEGVQPVPFWCED